jgi:hypothetical protein
MTIDDGAKREEPSRPEEIIIMCRRTILTILCFVVFSIVAPDIHAETTVGRYQMVTLPTKPGSFDSRVMILDTADGHLWQWWEAPVIGSSAPSSGIAYLGKVTPGSTTNETLPIHRSGPPEPVMPKR